MRSPLLGKTFEYSHNLELPLILIFVTNNANYSYRISNNIFKETVKCFPAAGIKGVNLNYWNFDILNLLCQNKCMMLDIEVDNERIKSFTGEVGKLQENPYLEKLMLRVSNRLDMNVAVDQLCEFIPSYCIVPKFPNAKVIKFWSMKVSDIGEKKLQSILQSFKHLEIFECRDYSWKISEIKENQIIQV